MVATGNSYRVGDQELIQFNKDWARLDAASDNHERTLKLVESYGKVSKSYVIDGKAYKLMTLQRKLPVVLFEPNDLFLLTAQPDLRRSYLDRILEQTLPGYATTRKHYRRALLQRNTLLKGVRRPSQEQLFVWNLRLSELGGVIGRARYALIDSIGDTFPALYQRIAGAQSTTVAVAYTSKLKVDSYETMLLKTLEETYDLDVGRGFTSAGPHRDDFVIYFNKRPTAEVASRGEIRTAVLALKIYELQMFERVREQKPLLLLDDVFSELDGRRRHALAEFLEAYQTFITTTDADMVLSSLMATSNVIPLISA